jgi:hypothetical protein
MGAKKKPSERIQEMIDSLDAVYERSKAGGTPPPATAPRASNIDAMSKNLDAIYDNWKAGQGSAGPMLPQRTVPIPKPTQLTFPQPALSQLPQMQGDIAPNRLSMPLTKPTPTQAPATPFGARPSTAQLDRFAQIVAGLPAQTPGKPSGADMFRQRLEAAGMRAPITPIMPPPAAPNIGEQFLAGAVNNPLERLLIPKEVSDYFASLPAETKGSKAARFAGQMLGDTLTMVAAGEVTAPAAATLAPRIAAQFGLSLPFVQRVLSSAGTFGLIGAGGAAAQGLPYQQVVEQGLKGAVLGGAGGAAGALVEPVAGKFLGGLASKAPGSMQNLANNAARVATAGLEGGATLATIGMTESVMNDDPFTVIAKRGLGDFMSGFILSSAFQVPKEIKGSFVRAIEQGKDLSQYRRVLGIPANATDAEIRAAYRKLARQWHPDINKAPDASARMAEINDAYNVLINANRLSEAVNAFAGEQAPQKSARRQAAEAKAAAAAETPAGTEPIVTPEGALPALPPAQKKAGYGQNWQQLPPAYSAFADEWVKAHAPFPDPGTIIPRFEPGERVLVPTGDGTYNPATVEETLPLGSVRGQRYPGGVVVRVDNTEGLSTVPAWKVRPTTRPNVNAPAPSPAIPTSTAPQGSSAPSASPDATTGQPAASPSMPRYKPGDAIMAYNEPATVTAIAPSGDLTVTFAGGEQDVVPAAMIQTFTAPQPVMPEAQTAAPEQTEQQTLFPADMSAWKFDVDDRVETGHEGSGLTGTVIAVRQDRDGTYRYKVRWDSKGKPKFEVRESDLHAEPAKPAETPAPAVPAKQAEPAQTFAVKAPVVYKYMGAIIDKVNDDGTYDIRLAATSKTISNVPGRELAPKPNGRIDLTSYKPAAVQPATPFPEPWRERPYAKSGTVELVPVELLKRYSEYPDRRNTGWRNAAEFDELKRDIAEHGFDNELILHFNPNDSVALLGEGNHRLQIAEELGLTHVPVRGSRSVHLTAKDNAKPVPGWKMPDDDPYYHFPGDFAPSMIFPQIKETPAPAPTKAETPAKAAVPLEAPSPTEPAPAQPEGFVKGARVDFDGHTGTIDMVLPGKKDTKVRVKYDDHRLTPTWTNVNGKTPNSLIKLLPPDAPRQRPDLRGPVGAKFTAKAPIKPEAPAKEAPPAAPPTKKGTSAHSPDDDMVVAAGLGGNTFGTFRVKPNGSLSRVSSPAMPMVKTREEAEANLAKYREKKAKPPTKRKPPKTPVADVPKPPAEEIKFPPGARVTNPMGWHGTVYRAMGPVRIVELDNGKTTTTTADDLVPGPEVPFPVGSRVALTNGLTGTVAKISITPDWGDRRLIRVDGGASSSAPVEGLKPAPEESAADIPASLFSKVNAKPHPLTLPPKGNGYVAPGNRGAIWRYINKEFAPLRRKLVPTGANGVYKTWDEVMRVRGMGLGTITHELGHHIDMTLNLNKLPHADETIASSVQAPLYPGNPTVQRLEGIADFMSRWMQNPEATEPQAPAFAKELRATLLANPAMQTKIEGLLRLTVPQAGADAYHDLLSAVELKKHVEHLPPAEKIVQIQRWFTDNIVSGYAPIGRTRDAITGGVKLAPEDDPEILAKLATGRAASNTDAWLTENRRDPAHPDVVLGPSFDDIAKGIPDTDWNAFLYGMHIQEDIEKGLVMPVDAEKALKAAATAMKNSPLLAERAPKMYKLLKDVNQYFLVNGGILSAEDAAKLDEEKLYVPMYRDLLEDEQGRPLRVGGKNFTGTGTTVRGQKGGTEQFINVLDNIQRKVADAATLYHKYKVPQSLKRLVEKYPGGGGSVELLSLEENPELANMSRAELDAMKIIPFRDKGQLAFLKPNKELFEAIKGMDETPPSSLEKLAAIPATAARAGSVLSPVFMGRNFLGDIPDAVLYSQYGFMPWHVIAGLTHVLKKDDAFKAFMANGGMTMTQTAIDKNIKRNTELRLGAKPTLWERTGKHVVDALQTAGDVVEWAPRVWEHDQALKAGASATAAANAANDVTLPHGYSGKLTKRYNRITPFSGSAIRAMDRLARAFKANPVGMTVKSLIMFGIPAAILTALNMHDPYYEALPEYRKVNNWCVPLGDGTFLFLPKRSTPSVMLGAGVEATMTAIYKGDSAALRELKDAAASQMPSLVPSFLAWPLIWKDIDPYTGEKIVPRGEESLPPRLRYGTNTTALAKAFGSWLNTSPRKIDAFIKSQTGGLGVLANSTIVSPIARWVTKDKAPVIGQRLNDIPVVKDFLTTPEYGSADVEEFYRVYQRMNSLNSSVSAVKNGKLPMESLRITKAQRDEFIQKWDAYRAAEAQMRKWREYRVAVERDPKLDPQTKRTNIYAANIMIINLARMAAGKKEMLDPSGKHKVLVPSGK